MTRLISSDLANLKPYIPGEQPKEASALKLNTNENPYGPSPRALEAIRQAVTDDLRLYPEHAATDLRQAIAEANGISMEQVFIGNSSDEVLAHVYRALFQRPGLVLVPDITYSYYTAYGELYHVQQKRIPLADDLTINVADYTASYPEGVAGIIFANPNAPTGLALPLADIARIAQAHPDTAVVVDEAYVDFGGESAVSLLDAHDNIVVVQTLSKSRSLAGLRVGFIMASPTIIDALTRVKDSFNSFPVDNLALAGATAAMRDTAHFDRTRRAIIQAREQLSQDLVELGFEVVPSATNFVFARHPRHDAVALMQALRARDILVRHFDHPRINQYLRITVGTSDECGRLYRELANILAGID
ncbi:MAG TPA: histidinol-phosphate transaminase [Burkholderiaceae bacterium]|nr:histidinol-phosphate transaminase [Burkholderiaceae bacterium]